MTRYAEPPNGSSVGFGQPIESVWNRLDEYAPREHPDERWFEAEKGPGDPLCWEALCDAAHRDDEEPQLLTAEPLPPLPDDGTPDPAETANDHFVGVQGDHITMLIPATGPMTRDKALRLAAWLQLCADPGGERFEQIRDACANT